MGDSSTPEEIESAALALPREERARLAERLNGSLDEEDALRAEWDAEIKQSLERYDRGEAESVPADEVFADIRDRLRK